MDATVTAGWFGLIGVAVGASGALVGGWLQQRYQAKTAVEWTATFDAVLLVVPCADEIRERVFEVVRHLGFYDSLGRNHSEANLWIGSTCKEAIELLSAFLREEPLPQRSRPFMDQIGMVQAHRRAGTNPS
ncbi:MULTISPECIES: hypothetical protein [unclassified Streptomyces]|uniref:hypothetical protein n=1 Tax=unclassified Streptomyces TaxID=2593676 RepID=UPI0035DBE5D1